MSKDKPNVDVIVSWPRSCDYPLWRDFILSHKGQFNKIFIVFTETNRTPDFTDFVIEALNGEQFVFINSFNNADQDWRDVAVNTALDQSTAEWVWFTEQDLLVTGSDFWTTAKDKMAEYDAFGYKEGDRVHPSNMWVKREFINKTKRDFSVEPDKMDHFGKFYYQLRHAGARMWFWRHQIMFSHMNGMSHNMTLMFDGTVPVWNEADYFQTMLLSLQVEPLDPRYEATVKSYIKDYKRRLYG